MAVPALPLWTVSVPGGQTVSGGQLPKAVPALPLWTMSVQNFLLQLLLAMCLVAGVGKVN